MEFYLDIDTLEKTIEEYEKVLKNLESRRTAIETSIKELIDNGWEGATHKEFKEKHEITEKKFESFKDEVESLKNILQNEVKEKADELKRKSDALPTCFSGQDSSMAGHNILYLDYSNVSKIKSMLQYEFYDIGSVMNTGMDIISGICEDLMDNSLTLTSTISTCKESVNKNMGSLYAFAAAFDEYKQGIEELDSSACESFSKITGVKIDLNDTAFNSAHVSKYGLPDTTRLTEAFKKQRNGEPLTPEEISLLNYAEKLLGDEKFKQLRYELANSDSFFNSSLVNIVSKYFNDSTGKIEFISEKIVVSGDKEGNHLAQNFIETAIKQIKDWEKNGKPDEKITWMVVKTGYTDADIEVIEKAAKKYNVELKYIDSINDLANHINTGYDRDEVKITDVSFFAHGLRNDGGTIALDYTKYNKLAYAATEGEDVSADVASDINISSSELLNSGINRNAFSNVHTFFGACNLGTVTDMGNGTKTSFMDSWTSITGGEAEGVTDPTPYSVPGAEGKNIDNAGGQSDFANIRGTYNKALSKIRRTFGTDSDINIDGCDNYLDINKKEGVVDQDTNQYIYDEDGNQVNKNSDVYWERVYEDGTKEKIEQGGPR